MKTYYDLVSYSSIDECNLSPIIFLHGLAEFRMTWKKVAPAIAKMTGRKAYLPDARNHGNSPRMAEMNYEILTQDLVEFMDDQGIRKAVVVGHSMGGRTAINFALRHPEKTDLLVVEDMTPMNVESGIKSFAAEGAKLLKKILETLPSDMDLETGKRSLVESLASFANGKFLDAETVMKHFDMDMVPLQKVGNTFMPMFDLDATITMLKSNPLVQNLPEQGLTFHGDALFLYGSKPFFKMKKIMKTYYDQVSYSSIDECKLPPIIFLHGLTDYRMTWRNVAPVIAKKTGRKAYMPDARNHGNSLRMAEMNCELLTQDLVEFMEDQEIEKAAIVGHSMGGRTAINFALKHPEKTDLLVVEDMTPMNVESGDKSFVAGIAQLWKKFLKTLPSDMDSDTAKRRLLEALTSLGNGKFLDAEKILKNYDLDMVALQKVGNTFMPMFDLDATIAMLKLNPLVQNLPEQDLTFHGDTLFLYGSKPFFKIEKDASINKLFPRAVKMKIEGGSHMIHLDSPDAFSHVVSNFILHRNLKNSKY